MGVCEPLMPDVVSLNEPTYLQIHYNMVGGYTENLEKPQNCQNRGVDACTGMGACSGQYGNILASMYYLLVEMLNIVGRDWARNAEQHRLASKTLPVHCQITVYKPCIPVASTGCMSSGGVAATSMFIWKSSAHSWKCEVKNNGDMEMGLVWLEWVEHLWLNGWVIYDLMGEAVTANFHSLHVRNLCTNS